MAFATKFWWWGPFRYGWDQFEIKENLSSAVFDALRIFLVWGVGGPSFTLLGEWGVLLGVLPVVLMKS